MTSAFNKQNFIHCFKLVKLPCKAKENNQVCVVRLNSWTIFIPFLRIRANKFFCDAVQCSTGTKQPGFFMFSKHLLILLFRSSTSYEMGAENNQVAQVLL